MYSWLLAEDFNFSTSCCLLLFLFFSSFPSFPSVKFFGVLPCWTLLNPIYIVSAQMPDHTAATRLGAVINSMRQAASIFWLWEAKFKGVQFQGTAMFLGRPLISVAPGAKIVLGDGVRIASARRANPLGLAQPSVLRALASQAQLVLGAGVGLSGAVLCAGNSIEIGQQTILGAGAMVLDTDMHAPSGDFDWRVEFVTNSRPIKIGRGVFIGARAIILKGVNIGDRALIGAGAVVAGDVPAGHVAVGNPARILEPKPVPGHAH